MVVRSDPAPATSPFFVACADALKRDAGSFVVDIRGGEPLNRPV
ncbi:hypothetical protein [Streptomyces sp. NPDC058701]